MYESRKNMGDVCKDVSSSIEERKDVLSEEQQHHRDSEPRQDKVKLHLSHAAELGFKNAIIQELRKAFPNKLIGVNVRCFPFVIIVKGKMLIKGPNVITCMFSLSELLEVQNVIDYITAVCIEKFEEALKGVTK